MSNAEGSARDPAAAALLCEGMAAARSGDRDRARELLTQAVKRDDRNVTAWLWLSGVVDDLDQREICLQTALQLDPQNEAVQRGLAHVRKQKVDDLLRTGMNAAQQGQRDHARRLLLRVVEMDERNLAAWLGLADLVTNLEDRETALENALTLAPGDEAIRRRLEQVREQLALERDTRAEMSPQFEEASKQGGPAPVPITMELEPAPPADEFDNELLCPCCAAPTAFADKRCPACGADLVRKTRVREERSSYLWIAISIQLLQVMSNLGSLFAAFAALALMLYQEGIVASPTIGEAWQFLLRPPANAPAMMGANLLGLRLLLAGVVIEALLSIVVLVGLYMRWRLFWYLFLGNAGLGLLMAVAAMLVSKSLICGGIMVLLAGAMVFLAFQIQDDFFYNYSRILLRPDRSARSAVDYLSHARQYARQGLWALAVVHYQRAAGLMLGRLEPHLGLALALSKIKRYDRAAAALAEARRIAPDSPHVAELAALLEEAK